MAGDREAWRAVEDAVSEAPVSLHGQPWGRLVAGPGSALPLLATTAHRVAER
ncbi:MAG: hypothetical protein JWQ95_4637 [Sphaerisporangium sp.]|nr:hypothetical protein [Sphaerisporangium sp.]